MIAAVPKTCVAGKGRVTGSDHTESSYDEEMDYPELDRRKLFAFRTYRRRPTKVAVAGRLAVAVRRMMDRFRRHGSAEDPYAYVGAPTKPSPPKLRFANRLPLP
jgi:hypothetical protein